MFHELGPNDIKLSIIVFYDNCLTSNGIIEQISKMLLTLGRLIRNTVVDRHRRFPPTFLESATKNTLRILTEHL